MRTHTRAAEADALFSVVAATDWEQSESEVPARLGVCAWVEAPRLELLDVISLSPEQVWMTRREHRVTLAREPSPRAVEGRLWLEHEDLRIGPLPAGIQAASKGGAQSRLRGVFDMPLSEHRRLAGWIAALRERDSRVRQPAPVGRLSKCIESASGVVALLSLFARERTQGFLRNGSESWPICVDEVDVGAGKLSLRYTGPAPAAPLLISFGFLHAVFDVPVTDFAMRDGQLVTSLPPWIERRCHRKQRRAAPSAGTVIELQHPRWEEIRIARPVCDLSRTGVAFASDPVEDLLYPGLEVPKLWLRDEHGHVVPLRGQIRSSRRVGQRQVVLGVEIVPADETGAQAQFADVVESTLYPDVHARALDAWDVYEQSGYFELSGKSPADFAEMRGDYLRSAGKIARAKDIAAVAQSPACGPPRATISYFRVYSKTWLICQGAKLRGRNGTAVGPSDRAGLREMYLLMYERVHSNPEAKWCLAYVQEVAPTWSKQLHLEFVRHCSSAPGEGAVVPFRAIECSVEATRHAHGHVASTDSVAVVPVDDRLAPAILRQLASMRPVSYLEALDLTVENWDLGQLRGAWSKYDLERERIWFVALRGERPSAVAVVELAEPGLHLYGLLDCLRLYPLDAEGEAAFPQLFEVARAWFEGKGRARFVYLEEWETPLTETLAGLRDLGRAWLTLMPGSRVPEFLHEVYAISRPVEARGEPRQDPTSRQSDGSSR